MSAPTPEHIAALTAQLAQQREARNAADVADRAASAEITRLTGELEAAKRWRPDGQEELTVRLSAPIWRGVNKYAYGASFRNVGLVKNPLGTGSVWAISDGYMLVITHASDHSSKLDRAYSPEAVKALGKTKSGVSGPELIDVAGVAYQNLPDLFPEVKLAVERITGPALAAVTLKAEPLIAALLAMFEKTTGECVTIRFQNDLIQLESADAFAITSTDKNTHNEMRADKLRGRL